jgi:hypothetical protein
MHQIKPELRRHDLEGIHLPSFRLSEPTAMTIHWKALEEHFLMAPLVFF